MYYWVRGGIFKSSNFGVFFGGTGEMLTFIVEVPHTEPTKKNNN